MKSPQLIHLEMALISRVKKFADILTKTTCTDFKNEALDLEFALLQVMDLLREIKANKNRLFLVGNGGSAAIASHAMVDFVNVAKIPAQVLHESSLSTCMANDYGYENVYSQALDTYLQPHDLLIAISSSGKSFNICNAAKIAQDKMARVITLSGFKSDNALRKLGHFNFWLESNDYGFVEVGHQFILHNLTDRFNVENGKYST